MSEERARTGFLLVGARTPLCGVVFPNYAGHGHVQGSLQACAEPACPRGRRGAGPPRSRANLISSPGPQRPQAKACSAIGRGQFASTTLTCTSLERSAGKGMSETQPGMCLTRHQPGCLTLNLSRIRAHPAESTNDVRIKCGIQELSGKKRLPEITGDLLTAVDSTRFHVTCSVST